MVPGAADRHARDDDRGRRGPADHPVLVGLAALAALVTILAFLIQVGVITLPGRDDDGGGGGGGGDPSDPVVCEPVLSLSDGSGPSGTEVVVTGSGFFPDQEVTLLFHVEEMTPARTDAEGRFEAAVVIPGTMDPFAPQQFQITARTGPCAGDTPFDLTR